MDFSYFPSLVGMIRLLVPHVEQPLHESAQNRFSYEKLFSGQKSLHILGGKGTISYLHILYHV